MKIKVYRVRLQQPDLQGFTASSRHLLCALLPLLMRVLLPYMRSPTTSYAQRSPPYMRG